MLVMLLVLLVATPGPEIDHSPSSVSLAVPRLPAYRPIMHGTAPRAPRAQPAESVTPDPRQDHDAEAFQLALRDPDVATRLAAVGRLEARADAAAAGILADALSDPDVRVRRVATLALESMPAGAAVGPLRRALHDPDPHVRQAAIEGLGELGANDAVVDALLLALQDVDPDVRIAAVELLGELRAPRARSLLATALADPSAVVRETAAEALAE